MQPISISCTDDIIFYINMEVTHRQNRATMEPTGRSCLLCRAAADIRTASSRNGRTGSGQLSSSNSGELGCLRIWDLIWVWGSGCSGLGLG